MHALGFIWDHNHSTLILSRVNNSNIKKRLTRREVLRLVSKVYDPMDLVAPFTLGFFLS